MANIISDELLSRILPSDLNNIIWDYIGCVCDKPLNTNNGLLYNSYYCRYKHGHKCDGLI
jgi:hypothetical protein